MKKLGFLGWILLVLIVLSVVFPSYLIKSYLQLSDNFDQRIISVQAENYTPSAQTCDNSKYQLVNGKKIYLSKALASREEKGAGVVILHMEDGSTASMLLAPNIDEFYSRETFDTYIESVEVTPQSFNLFDPINVSLSKYKKISNKNIVLIGNGDIKYQIKGTKGFSMQKFDGGAEIIFSNFSNKEGWSLLFSNSSDSESLDCTIKEEMQ